MLRRWFGHEQPESGASAELAESLAKTREGWRERLLGVLGPVDISQATWDELEERLVRSDVGAVTAAALVAELRAAARDAGARRADELPRLLAEVMRAALEEGEPAPQSPDGSHDEPVVIVVVGVNGSGKSTTIAKMARTFQRRGASVVLVAADTFRAAAIEQLEALGERVGAPVLSGSAGADPAAVTFDALSSRAAQSAGVVIVDTAGRLHTQPNLMAELAKLARVCGRVVPGAPHETWLVLDATTGQNGLAQARAFRQAVNVTGVVLAKLDSSSKGGVVFAVRRELGLPVRFVGIGEGLDDLEPFDARAFVAGVLGEDAAGSA